MGFWDVTRPAPSWWCRWFHRRWWMKNLYDVHRVRCSACRECWDDGAGKITWKLP